MIDFNDVVNFVYDTADTVADKTKEIVGSIPGKIKNIVSKKQPGASQDFNAQGDAASAPEGEGFIEKHYPSEGNEFFSRPYVPDENEFLAKTPAEEIAEVYAEAPAEESSEVYAEAPAEESSGVYAEAPAEESSEVYAESPAEESPEVYAEAPDAQETEGSDVPDDEDEYIKTRLDRDAEYTPKEIKYVDEVKKYDNGAYTVEEEGSMMSLNIDSLNLGSLGDYDYSYQEDDSPYGKE